MVAVKEGKKMQWNF